MRRKQNRKKDKAISMFKHSERRAWQRYGIVLTRHLHNRMCNEILSGRSIFLVKQSVSRSIHIVEVDDARYKVVYDNTRKALKTFLDI